MDDSTLSNLSENMFNSFIKFNKTVFNHNEITKNIPIPPSHFKVIFHTLHCGPAAISHIAKELGISKPNMTPIIDKLIEDGYVIRYPDPSDRRILRIEATEKSHEFLLQQKNKIKELLKQKLSKLSDEDIYELSDIMSKLNSIMCKLT